MIILPWLFGFLMLLSVFLAQGNFFLVQECRTAILAKEYSKTRIDLMNQAEKPFSYMGRLDLGATDPAYREVVKTVVRKLYGEEAVQLMEQLPTANHTHSSLCELYRQKWTEEQYAVLQRIGQGLPGKYPALCECFFWQGRTAGIDLSCAEEPIIRALFDEWTAERILQERAAFTRTDLAKRFAPDNKLFIAEPTSNPGLLQPTFYQKIHHLTVHIPVDMRGKHLKKE